MDLKDVWRQYRTRFGLLAASVLLLVLVAYFAFESSLPFWLKHVLIAPLWIFGLAVSFWIWIPLYSSWLNGRLSTKTLLQLNGLCVVFVVLSFVAFAFVARLIRIAT